MNPRTKPSSLFVALAMAFVLLIAQASEIKFAWDPSPSPEVGSYRFYSKSLTKSTNINVGNNVTATIQDLGPGQWEFWVTAVTTNNIESDPSNKLIVDVPLPPLRMRTVVLQYSGTISNFYDVGFFKLRLP